MPRASSEPERVLQRLDWTVVKRLDGLLQGDYRTLFRGFGFEMAELREYQLTDDVRAIDWNVTARMQTPWVRLFIEDRDITAWFLLDLSPSVDFGTARGAEEGPPGRFHRRARAAAHAPRTTASGPWCSPAGRRACHSREGRADARPAPHPASSRRQPRLPRAPRTDLSALLDSALRMIRRRSLLFIVSDFLSVPGWDRRLAMVAHRHETLARAALRSPGGGAPGRGPARAGGRRDGRAALRRHSRPAASGGASRSSPGSAREELQAMLTRAGVDLLGLSTEGDLAGDIVRFAAARAQRRRAQFLPRPARGPGPDRRRARHDAAVAIPFVAAVPDPRASCCSTSGRSGGGGSTRRATRA